MNIVTLMTLLALGRTFHAAAAINITVCNCEQAEVVGLMDIQQPAYCDKQLIQKAPVIDKYEFFITEKPHAIWKGHLCMAWIKERTIDGYFFGSYDTIDTIRVQPVSAEECTKMKLMHDCAGNVMEETKNKLFSFKASPTGEGYWMRTVKYSVKNCLVQEITLKKDCLDCPITSPYGVLTNKSETTSVVTHDSTIIWVTPTWKEDEKCSLKRVQTGMGIVTELDDGSSKLSDESNQLEFHFEKETTQICKHKFNKLKNIPGAYVQISGMTNRTGTHFYNKDLKKCLNSETLTLERCSSTDAQKFNVVPNLPVQTEIKNATRKNCFGFSKNSLTKRGCSLWILALFHGLSRVIWNSETKQITDGTQCLEARNKELVAAKCDEQTAQQWLLEAPKHQEDNTFEENQPLLAQHHQFVEDKLVAQENILQEEIKRIHCGNLQIRRFTTHLLAESSGLLAARANNLPLCHRLKSSGKNLIVQRCEPKTIAVTARQTKCGFEPEYENYTIGKDGFSLHPFQECFWNDKIINLNSQSYRWNNITREWVQQYPTAHLASIKLIEKFKDIADNEYQYATQHHPSDNSHEFEEMNVLNELVTRIRAEDTGSVSALLVSKNEETRFGNTASWTERLKVALTWVIAMTILLTIAVVLISLIGPRKMMTTKEFTLRLQAWRLKQQLLCSRLRNRKKTEGVPEPVEMDTGSIEEQ